MPAIAGLIVGLSPFVITLLVTLVFGFVLEYVTWWVWLLIYLPAPVIGFWGGARRMGPAWRRGFLIGLAMSGFASLIFGPGARHLHPVACDRLSGRAIDRRSSRGRALTFYEKRSLLSSASPTCSTPPRSSTNVTRSSRR